MTPQERLILALDVDDHDTAIGLIRKFHRDVDIFKVGLALFTSVGPRIIREIHLMGKRVFLDLKFHDIPNTVSQAAVAATRLGVFMLNVHTLGGFEMMSQTAKAVSTLALKENISRPRIVGVTVLTSIDQQRLRDELGIELRMSIAVKHLASLARRAGLDGVVASAEDAGEIKARLGKDFIVVSPGIRPSWASIDDQRRVMTPKQAIRNGVDYIVVGRPVLAHPDPKGALKRIIDEIADA